MENKLPDPESEDVFEIEQDTDVFSPAEEEFDVASRFPHTSIIWLGMTVAFLFLIVFIATQVSENNNNAIKFAEAEKQSKNEQEVQLKFALDVLKAGVLNFVIKKTGCSSVVECPVWGRNVARSTRVTLTVKFDFTSDVFRGIIKPQRIYRN